MADLQRRVIAFLEGRRTAELSDLIQRHNGIPLAAPCLREVHTPDSPLLQVSIQRVLDADVGVAIFLTELCPRPLRRPIGIAIELLAGIPSIIYGIWGFFVFAPWFQLHVQEPVANAVTDIPVLGTLFGGSVFGLTDDVEPFSLEQRAGVRAEAGVVVDDEHGRHAPHGGTARAFCPYG